MAEVRIREVKSGSILARDVTLPGGSLLVKRGVALTDRRIAFLQNHGIQTVFIEDDPSDAKPTKVADSVYAERCRRLDRMFEALENAPHMAAIREAARQRLRLKRAWE